MLNDSVLLESSRARSVAVLDAHERAHKHFVAMLTAAGLAPVANPDFDQHDPSHFLEYYDLILRDWAWESDSEGNDQTQNNVAFNKLKAVLPQDASLGNVLVLGAGACRLSWDIHCHMNTKTTTVVDVNPVLLSAGNLLLNHGLSFDVVECPQDPADGRPEAKEWRLEATRRTPKNMTGWSIMAANVWSLPFKKGSFDTIITPWFLDVNGKDACELIALIDSLLKPNGRWVNSGPLLYGDDIPFASRYSHKELRELIALGMGSICSESIVPASYLDSPITSRQRTEEVWSFCAIKNQASREQAIADYKGGVPAWLVLAHLPIDRRDIQMQKVVHPVAKQLVALLDGECSISDVASRVKSNLDPSIDAMQLVKSAFKQIIE